MQIKKSKAAVALLPRLRPTAHYNGQQQQ